MPGVAEQISGSSAWVSPLVGAVLVIISGLTALLTIRGQGRRDATGGYRDLTESQTEWLKATLGEKNNEITGLRTEAVARENQFDALQEKYDHEHERAEGYWRVLILHRINPEDGGPLDEGLTHV